ncbi:MAG: hypothetical protein AAGM22_07970 [Acidobacteriota bacterium]
MNERPLHHGLARTLGFCLALALGLGFPGVLLAGAFLGASDSASDLVLHPIGYDGTGGQLDVSICIDPASTEIPQMEVPMQNVATIWNALEPTTGNLFLGGNNEIPQGQIDWESTILHEIGHCIGLAHPNAASESGLPGNDRNYTKAGNGANNVFDIDPGTDGVIGSADDLRGDDVNLHWFNASNNPFVLESTVDGTTYTRDPGSLPPGDLFAANADRTVSALPRYGLPNTEASMQQGAFTDEAQRTLVADDIATVRIAAAGLDEIEGTADDYTLNLVYAGVTNSCDIVVRLINTTSFAFCSTSSTSIGSDGHRVLTSAAVTTGNFSWFFTDTLVDAGEIFADGFEAGNTSAWSSTIP